MTAVRVFQGVVDIAGQTGLTAHGLREIGVDAHGYFKPHPFGYALPPDSVPGGRTRVTRAARRAGALARFAATYDVFHFHTGVSFAPGALHHLDARLLRRIGRTVAVEFWGREVRLASVERSRNPYFEEVDPKEEQKRAFLQEWADITGGRVVISDHSFDPFLKPYFPHVHVVGQRIDTRRLTP